MGNRITTFLHGWPLFWLPAFAGIFAPWQNKLTAMSLVSEWFQPGLNIGASIIGPLTCVISYATLLRLSRARRIRVMLVAFAIFVTSLVICVISKLLIGVIYFPTPGQQLIVWAVLVIVYLGVFVALAVSMVSSGMNVRG